MTAVIWVLRQNSRPGLRPFFNHRLGFYSSSKILHVFGNKTNNYFCSRRNKQPSVYLIHFWHQRVRLFLLFHALFSSKFMSSRRSYFNQLISITNTKRINAPHNGSLSTRFNSFPDKNATQLIAAQLDLSHINLLLLLLLKYPSKQVSASEREIGSLMLITALLCTTILCCPEFLPLTYVHQSNCRFFQRQQYFII